MKNSLIYMILFALALYLPGCMGKNAYPPLEVAGRVDLTRYIGRWHEIARYPHSFEDGCSSVTADYTLQEDGSIHVLNQCRLGEQANKIKKAEGRAKVVDKRTNAKLKVSFFWPFYGDYWILDLDENYQYAVVGEPSRKYVWILSRTPEMESDLYEELVSKIRQSGYDPAKLIKTEHADALP